MNQPTATRRDPIADAIEQTVATIALYEDPKDPESIKLCKTIAALARATANVENALSWGEAMSPGARLRFFMFCARHGFDPTGNHVYVLGGRPYVSIEGRLFKAHGERDAKGVRTFAGFVEDRPLTRDEANAYGIPEDALGWLARVERTDCKYPFLGVGYAGGKSEKNPVARDQWVAMASKRARERALRLAYPIDASVEEGDLKEPATHPADVVSVTTTPNASAPAEPAAAQADAAAPSALDRVNDRNVAAEEARRTTDAAAPADVGEALTKERAELKRLEALNRKSVDFMRARLGLSTAASLKVATADQLAALNRSARAIMPEDFGSDLADIRASINRNRIAHAEAYKATLAAARSSVPDFDPDFATFDECRAFLDDLGVAAKKGGEQ